MKLLKTLFSVGAISVMSICSLNSLIPSSAKAQTPAGRYEIQGTQILFYPATGGDPLLVYKFYAIALFYLQVSNN